MGLLGTHDGCFHCDEVFAVFLLRQLPEFKDFAVIRTRDPDELASCDILVDVGGVYDPKTLRFDHHQKGFNVTWSSFFGLKSWNVKFSSAGLVYAHFGKRLLLSLTNWDVESEPLKRIFSKIYESFVLEIDGVDNGVSPSNERLKYNIRTGISQRVTRLNPWWNEPSKNTTSAFWEAVDLVGREFLDTVRYFAECWWPARDYVARAMANRNLVDSSQAIIVLEQSCPWKCHLFDLERQERADVVVYPQPLRLLTYRPEPKFLPRVLFVVLPCEDGNWAVQAVSSENFENRLPFPASWCALRDAELSEVTGIPGCIFVHSAGHFGLNKTREGALEMARQIIRESEAKELLLNQTSLQPPTFSRGRVSHLHTIKGSRFH
ncbi:Metal-dependent protein hydrolase [Paragonimus heterotremus]|uniref:Metal-dependent protein hydrolase n=1 Tax=Paragonimus heterotremus TaxID=100268 RepID=A0A8J4SX77_9TREM|nr:Metal-dependent protein hydrolase [Paragonimus heterotremus]